MNPCPWKTKNRGNLRLIGLATRLGVRLRIAHYPPYTSKWNPIEHRLFSQVERAWSGVMLDCPETARLLDATYDLGRACSETFRDVKDRFIRHDRVNGQWNYLVDPHGFA
jgi:hypothetical protein